MRSPRELAFRLSQEAGNFGMWLRPPRAAAGQAAPLEGLAAPRETAAALCGTLYARRAVRTAAGILEHRFPLLGITVETGPELAWRRDPVSGIATAPRYFRFIPYLDAARAGDHKLIWELNRHQHWVLLAQAFLLDGRREFLDEIWREWESWTRENPFLCGINWTSALEVAFRALSWTWVYHLAGDQMEAGLRRRFLQSLYRHGRYLERNLSHYFSPNTHLLGEAVALHALGALFPAFPRARRWRETGARIVREQLDRQVRPDGSHFEQSSYYHVYALDMFLFHAMLAGAVDQYREALARMASYLHALFGPARRLPFLGDDDGGRFFHPYGERALFGRATLATAAALLGGGWGSAPEDAHEQAAWWLGPRAIAHTAPATMESRLFEDAGVAVMSAGVVQVVVDAGGFGPGSGGHSHSDTLSLVACSDGEEVLIDPGTYTYVGDPEWRDRFRGSAAHSTIRVDGRDQAVAAGPFRWSQPPQVELRRWSATPAQDYLHAAVRYGGFEHSRRVLFLKPDLLFVLDEIGGPEGEHEVEQFWHAGGPVRALGAAGFAIHDNAVLALASPAGVSVSEGGEYGWRSEALGIKAPAPLIRVSRRAALPLRFAALLHFGAGGRPCRLRIGTESEECVELLFEAERSGVVKFPRDDRSLCLV
ncbi:MAG TPA: alginate lyase family protein [Bryobacteraceae bacterium]|nr:alginate lyase family protein [Bryobacteraceae bacterium]